MQYKYKLNVHFLLVTIRNTNIANNYNQLYKF